MTEDQLDARLADWQREYGWGGMPRESSGTNILAQLIDHKGFVPNSRGYIPVPIKTLADEVEAAIQMMQSTRTDSGPNSYYRAAMVLRVEHLTPQYWPEQERLSRLRKIGLDMSRHTYYRALAFGRAFLMGHFSQKAVA